jgi:hypothetical protein
MEVTYSDDYSRWGCCQELEELTGTPSPSPPGLHLHSSLCQIGQTHGRPHREQESSALCPPDEGTLPRAVQMNRRVGVQADYTVKI